MDTPNPIFRLLIYASAALLGFEALGMFLMWHGAWFPSWVGFITYHSIMVLVVSLTAALVLLRAAAPGKIDIPMTIAFVAVLLAFNPLAPLDAVAFKSSTLFFTDLIAIGLLVWVASRRSPHWL